MKTNAKKTGNLIGTTSLMVLGILFLSVLPLNTVKAENFEKSDCLSSLTSHIAIEPWMLSLDDWRTDELTFENEATVDVKSWMMAPEYWDKGLETELSEVPATDFDSVDIWMFEPTEWGCDFAELQFAGSDRDMVMLPLYF